MNTIAVTSYKQLLEEIEKLPLLAGGMIHVFRGQPMDYGAMLSSFGRLRRTKTKSELHDVFLRHIFIKSGLLMVLGDLLKLPSLSPTDTKVTAADFYMAEALVQHYGYQTRYIDVTPSLDVALWFALHRFQGQNNTPVGEFAPFRLTFPAWYDPVTEPGILYVLGAKPWNRVSSIDAGEYINLLDIAPKGVNRPQRQKGGLLYAPAWGPAEGDISGLVQAKFEVRFPWEEVGQHWETDDLFPGPGEDPIYNSLLRAPFFRTPRKLPNGSEETIYRRSFTLPEYCRGPGDTRQELYRVNDQVLQPTLYHPWLRRKLDQLQANPAWPPNLRPPFEQAIPIMLQRPSMLFSMHRGGVALPPEEPPQEVPLSFKNFFLEYSPEEFALAYDENRMRRGFWCFWLGPDEFLLQSFGTTEGRPQCSEICVYQWQPGHGLVQTSGPDTMGSYVTFPLDLIRMTGEGLVQLDAPGYLGHGYYGLYTTERFWTALPTWTDLW